MAGNLVLVNLESRAITCQVASSESVTAGAFVKTEASDDVCTSSASAGSLSDYSTADILVSECDTSGDEDLCIGIAAYDAAAGVAVTVYTQGLFMVRSSAAVTAGHLIQNVDGADPYEVADITDINNNAEEQEVIGRALTGTSGADKYLIILLNVA